MTKEYRRTIYWVNTKKLCGAVAVDQDGFVFKWDTAPCYRWMSGKKFTKMLNILKYKKALLSCKQLDKEVDPF
jgi:hypothetical protein